MGLYSHPLPSITQPGDLDRKVTLRSRADTQDNLGQPVPTWTAVHTDLPCLYVPRGGREVYRFFAQTAEAEGIIRIRAGTAVDSTWRAVLDSIVYEIIAPPVAVGRLFTDLFVRAITKT